MIVSAKYQPKKLASCSWRAAAARSAARKVKEFGSGFYPCARCEKSIRFDETHYRKDGVTSCT